jgi:hypothetical protein
MAAARPAARARPAHPIHGTCPPLATGTGQNATMSAPGLENWACPPAEAASLVATERPGLRFLG